MKRTKTQKGITLVALIITIIVLLILAVVTIASVTGDGIIQHAKNARDNYATAQVTENAILYNYIAKIEEETSNVTLLTFTMTKFDSANTKVYTYEEGMTWREWINSKYDSERFSADTIGVRYDHTEWGLGLFEYQDDMDILDDQIDPSRVFRFLP